jgi:trichodiene synthase
MGSLVKFFDTIRYEDTNFDRQERSGLLQHVHAETAAHFAQPHQRKGLDVEQPKLEAVMRISVQVVVCCWTQVSCEAMIDISIYFVYVVLVDDSSKNSFRKMDKFFGDFFSGTPQRYPFWTLMNGHLCDFVGHHGSFCSFAILRSTFDYFQGCWIETNDFQGFEGLRYVPHFLRRLNCLGGVCAGSLFPARQFDEEKLFDQVTTTIAHIEPSVVLVNDVISFYN